MTQKTMKQLLDEQKRQRLKASQPAPKTAAKSGGKGSKKQQKEADDASTETAESETAGDE